MRAAAVLAAASGFAAVAFGAFGAHGVAEDAAKAWLDTGAGYQLPHALAAFAALWAKGRGASGASVAAWLFIVGAAIFAGTLYAMALGAPRWLGAVTPVGGVCLLAGWGMLGWSGLTLARKEPHP